ncbi:MAG: energy transducer TonB [Marinifilaceae bacterium]
MEVKKNPNYDLEKKRGVFLQIGFAISLLFVLCAFEYSVPTNKVKEMVVTETLVEEELIPISRPEEKIQPPPPKEIPQLTDMLEVVDDDEEIETELDIVDVEANMEDEVEIKEIDDEEEEVEEVPFVRVENMPVFNPRKNKTYEEGLRDLFQHMQKSAKYPVIAQENGIQGKVFVRFVVTKTGKISNVQVARGVDPALDKEAIRVVNNLPRFKPGMQRGRPVSVWFSGFISFVLQ